MSPSQHPLHRSPSHEKEAWHTYRQLLYTARRVRRSVNALLKDYSLTGAQFALLTSIPEEGIPLTRLASLSWADPGNVSGIADRLESAGWIVRKRSQEDRRVVLVCLSELGRSVVEELLPRHRAAIAHAFQALSTDDMKSMRAFLDMMTFHDGR